MDYEKAYKEALERARMINNGKDVDIEAGTTTCEYIFPELRESEDERIRNFISNELACLRATTGKGSDRYEELTNAIAWLEKQAEQKSIDYNEELKKCRKNPLYFFDKYVKLEGQKPADKVEPKFHEGEWITNGDYTWKIVEVKSLDYILQSQDGNIVDDTISYVDEQFHSFTIQDAKDGDALASNKSIFIFQKEYIGEKPTAYCGLMNGLFIEGKGACWTNEKCYPATKEQRDLLSQKMHEAGYTFDFEKKELKKIEQKPAECRQETKPNGGIVLEDFNEGDGFYKVNLAYLSKSQVELVENLVTSWQNPTNNTVEWSEEDERVFHHVLSVLEEYGEEHLSKSKFVCNWLKSIKQRIGWKPTEEQMKALHDMNLTGNISYAGQGQVLIELYNDLKKL